MKILLILLFFLPNILNGHSGNTNSFGCHNKYADNTYHCHNDGFNKNTNFKNNKSSSSNLSFFEKLQEILDLIGAIFLLVLVAYLVFTGNFQGLLALAIFGGFMSLVFKFF